MLHAVNFTNHFLIAMPDLADPNFYHTVTYVCAHNQDGAMGIVINRPMDLDLGEVLDHMQIETTSSGDMSRHLPIYQGGPVQPERGFVLHQPPGKWDAMLMVTPQLGVTTSRDILTAIASGKGPSRLLVALGYAGWTAGQLEKEMAENAWLSAPADVSIMFDVPAERRWQAAAAGMGIDLNLLSTQAGHG
jgi:putative transcriptional regulator